MFFASHISNHAEPKEAVREVIENCLKQMDGKRAHLAFLFISGRYSLEWNVFLEELHEKLGPTLVMGCTCEGVIGSDQEYEFLPAMAMILASLPEVEMRPFHILPDEISISSPGVYWTNKTKISPEQDPIFVLIGDPFTCDIIKLTSEFNETYPKAPVIGGMASAVPQLKNNKLFINRKVFQHGAIGISLTGNIQIQTIVSQGCRPIGQPMRATKVSRNTIFELDGKPVFDVLSDLYHGLNPDEQALAQNSLFLGKAVDQHRPYFERGDFLIRNIVAFDEGSGGMSIGDTDLQKGQIVQFQLRDAHAAEEDFKILLELNQMMRGSDKPSGALLFSCLGRGAGLFGENNHDIRLVKKMTGEYPVAGFFCNGEIGPIGGKTFVHGYTSCLGLFFPKNHAR